MNIVKKIMALAIGKTKTTKVPKFLLPETAERYEAIKAERLEKQRAIDEKYCRQVAESRLAIDNEIEKNKQRIVSLRKESKEGEVREEIKRREIQRLEALVGKLSREKSEVLRQLSKMNEETRLFERQGIEYRLAIEEARAEERTKVRQEGKLLHFHSYYDGERKVFFFREKYFLWESTEEGDWMTDSLQQLNPVEFQAVAAHEAKRAAVS